MSSNEIKFKLNKVKNNKGKVLNIVHIIVHTGDFTREGTAEEVNLFLDWFRELPFKNKVLVAGNNDSYLELAYNNPSIDTIDFNGIHYLTRGDFELKVKWSGIPLDVDVLVTHTPPLGILDTTSENLQVGCEVLLDRLEYLQNLKAHLFGHVHKSRGLVEIEDVLYSNGSFSINRFEI